MIEKILICEAKLCIEQQGSNAGKIEATVTTWGAREGSDGRKFFYKPEGFAAWADEFSKSGKPLPMFVNHSADAIPVGQWDEFTFTDEGMTAMGRLFTNTSAGGDLYKVMQDSPRMFGGVSVSAYADEYQMLDEAGAVLSGTNADEGYFNITKGGLREVSVVMYPNNPMAEVSKLEYFRADGTPDLKVLEKTLRDAGLSKNDAVAAASKFRQVLEQRDAVTLAKPAPRRSESGAEATILAALEQRELLKSLSKRLKNVTGNH